MTTLLAGQAWAESAKPEPKIRISFRAMNVNKTTSLHIHSESQADQTEKTLKQLGCKTGRNQHNGHTDITFECQFWKSMNVKDQAEADKWIQWLTKHKFSVVENTPPKTRKETVQYQLKDWRAVHPRNEFQTKAYSEMFKMLGCEVTQQKHGDHEDIRYRCASWQTIGVSNHKLASEWMAALKNLGFATLHEH